MISQNDIIKYVDTHFPNSKITKYVFSSMVDYAIWLNYDGISSRYLMHKNFIYTEDYPQVHYSLTEFYRLLKMKIFI